VDMTSARTTSLTAANADKYRLYTLAFQEPLADVRFCREVFRQRVDRAAGRPLHTDASL
jgi:hypothetical protein